MSAEAKVEKKENSEEEQAKDESKLEEEIEEQAKEDLKQEIEIGKLNFISLNKTKTKKALEKILEFQEYQEEPLPLAKLENALSGEENYIPKNQESYSKREESEQDSTNDFYQESDNGTYSSSSAYSPNKEEDHGYNAPTTPNRFESHKKKERDIFHVNFLNEEKDKNERIPRGI